MYSFEGNYKRTPVQSLGGQSSTKDDKLSFLRRAQEERKKREESRRRTNSSIHIQSYYRSSKIRHQVKCLFRSQYDELLVQINRGVLSVETAQSLGNVLRLLLFFYNEKEDAERLATLCTWLLKHQAVFVQHYCQKHSLVSNYQLTRLLKLCCNYVVLISPDTKPLSPPLRVVNILTDPQNYPADSNGLDTLFATSFACSWYSMCSALLTYRIPSSIEEYTANPPTPLASSILELINKPFLIAQSKSCWNSILHSVCKSLLCEPFTPQLYYYALPAMVSQQPSIVFKHLLNLLLPEDSCMHESYGIDSHLGHLAVPRTSWLLCAVLLYAEKHLGTLSESELQTYLLLLYSLVGELSVSNLHLESDMDDNSDSEIEMEDLETNTMVMAGGVTHMNPAVIRHECLRLIDTRDHVHGIIRTLGNSPHIHVITAVCTLCHTLLVRNKLHIHQTRLLYSLAFNPTFLRNLWFACVSVTTEILTGSSASLLQMLSRGIQMSPAALDRIVPLLSVFCTLFSHSLITLHDAEFHGRTDLWDAEQKEQTKTKSSWTMPFQISELIPMSQALRDACLGIIELAHPETKPALRDDYRAAFISVASGPSVVGAMMTLDDLQKQRNTWAQLFRVIVLLVRQLYERDSRQKFCHHDHWLSDQVDIQADKPSQLYKSPNVFDKRRFGTLSTLNPNRADDADLPLLSTLETRHLTILTEIPFVVPFAERVKIFSRLVNQDHKEHQGEMRYLTSGGTIRITVRRNFLYEDAFEKLSPENEPNMKLRMQVQLINFAGLDEAGIDGGGLFREFLWELLQTAFDPNRGFFCTTTDRLLYPNPQVRLLFEDFSDHYYFLGRMLGKALYEGMLVELPFASFFMSKILSSHGGDVDIHHLASLDPEMYKNLLFLKNYTGDVSGLELDFTVVNNDFGEAQVIELKPGGADIAVDNSNRIEYIHRMAHYRLNRQIRAQCDAFRQGLADVINLEWLHMFDHRELQVLISGAHVPIDVDDLRRYTNYSGGYNEDHPVILNFWSVVRQFTDVQRQALLKFVTSCSRPPLLGFKDLFPAFCIHYGGKESDRLPSASTCMNLLKLPEFTDENTLRSKLKYAIESGTGFELS